MKNQRIADVIEVINWLTGEFFAAPGDKPNFLNAAIALAATNTHLLNSSHARTADGRIRIR